MFNAAIVNLRERLLTWIPGLNPYWERLKASPLGYRLARGAFWSLAGAGISRTLMLLSSMFVARWLGKEGFGQLGVIQNTVGMFGVFAGFGLGITATKHVAEYRNTDPQRTGRIIALMQIVSGGVSLVVLLLLALSAHFLAEHTLAAPEMAPLLLLGGLLLPFSALSGVQTGALSGFESFRAIAQANLLSGLASFPLMLAGTYLWGITGAVMGLVASQVANCILNHLFLQREAARLGVQLHLAGSSQDRRMLWDFSLPTVFTAATGWCASWACSAILVNQAAGYAQMGLVSVGNQWRAALMFLPGLLMNASLPVLANENAKNQGGFGHSIAISHKVIVWLVLPITLVLMLAADTILSLYGSGFQDGRAALVYMLAAAAISAVSSPAGSAIIAKGKMWFSLALNLLNAAIFLSLTWWLAPTRGAAGLSLAYFAAQFFQALLGYLYLKPQLPPGMFARNLAVMALIASIAFAILQVF